MQKLKELFSGTEPVLVPTVLDPMYKAVRRSYLSLAQDNRDPFRGAGGADRGMKAAQNTCGRPGLPEIERRTMKVR